MTLPSIGQDELQRLTHLLPQSAHELIRVLGYAAAGRLISRLGGITLYLHNGRDNLSDRSIYRMLGDTLSEDEVHQLFRSFGGAHFFIPRCDQAIRALRNARFLTELSERCQAGASIREAMTELCPRYGFSDRIGWQLLSQRKVNAQTQYQGSLFDH